eukprot:5452659-Lingulodinium_polyedra.AAC.1
MATPIPSSSFLMDPHPQNCPASPVEEYAWTPKVSVDKEVYAIACSEALPWEDFEAAFDDGAGVHDGIQADSVFESQG